MNIGKIRKRSKVTHEIQTICCLTTSLQFSKRFFFEIFKESFVVGADCRWPLLVLVVEYEETVWTFNGEEQTQFQTVLLANIQNRHLSDVRGKFLRPFLFDVFKTFLFSHS